MSTNRGLLFKSVAVMTCLTTPIAWSANSASTGTLDKSVPAATVHATNLATTNVAGATNAAHVVRQPLARVPLAIPTSPGLEDIVKLAQSGVEPQVLLSYVNSSPTAYSPSADELVYLHDVGIAPEVVTAIIEHGNQLREQAAAAQARASAAATSTQPTPSPSFAGAPPYSSDYLNRSPSYNVPESAPMPDQANNFYDALSPYGTWYDLPDYGWCWQPSVAVVQPQWRPYFDSGRWLDTDCGWYWQSDYSWGWAPFHYGRWCRYGGLGWVWAPDSVWGPSWVCWRTSPLYCGWAPLPPAATFGVGGFSYFGAGVGVGFGFGLGVSDFCFVPFGNLCAWNLNPFCLSPGFAGTIFNQTIVRNNFFRGPDGRIINGGIDATRVANAARSEIPKVSVRDLPPAAGKVVRPDRLERDGSGLVVYRPQPLSASPAKPAAQLSRNRQELTPQSAAIQPNTRSVSLTSRQPAVNSTRPAARPTSSTTASWRDVVPVARLPVNGPRSVQMTPPLLGRYPTQSPAPATARARLGSGLDAASIPMPLAFGGAAAPQRQEILKPASAERRFVPQPPSRAEAAASVRPSFYNPPPMTQTPNRSWAGMNALAGRSPSAGRSEPAFTAPSSRQTFYRSELAPPSANYARPVRSQSAMPNGYRTPSYVSRPSAFSRPTYSAPSYNYRPSYSTPHYAPAAPSYHSVSGFGSVGRASGYSGRSSSSSSSRSGH